MMQLTKEARFELGQIVATPGALHVLEWAGVAPRTLLNRHIRGDWGDLCSEDWQANEHALKDGSRIFSSYKLSSGSKVWIITEALNDGVRASTCLLLPDEY